MRKFLLSISIIFGALALNAQTSQNVWTVGGGVSLTDFSGPHTTAFLDFNEWKGIGNIYLGRYLNPSFDARLNTSFGKIFYPVLDADGDNLEYLTQEFMTNAALEFKYKFDNGYIFREEGIVGPYFMAGIGATFIDDIETNGHMPLGVGISIRPVDFLSLQVQSAYNLTFGGDNAYNYLQHSLGLGINFGSAAKERGPKILDTDNDGVPDEMDECPFVYGVLDFYGCPDSDEDGIGDSRDNCPHDKGPAKNNGCPFNDLDSDGIADADDLCPNEPGLQSMKGCPDSDGDGIADKDDMCPAQKGPKDNNGCPLGAIDTDGDGISDNIDKCPMEKGPATTAGCPTLLKDEIYFKKNSTQFTLGQLQTMNNVANYLIRNPQYSLNIKGHTCALGSEEHNMELALDRTNKTYKYMRSRGIASSRMVLIGYGEHRPEYDNMNVGVAPKNRRVELEVFE